MAADARGALERRRDIAASRLERLRDSYALLLAPPGERRPFHTMMTKQEVIDLLRRDPQGEIARYIYANLTPEENNELHRAISASIESDQQQQNPARFPTE